MTIVIERPRGTHDILPSEQPLWRRVTDEMERLCALYGYRRIQTPVFEDTELFARTSGAGSDVVQKEMYTFTDRSDRSLTLAAGGHRADRRAYIEHGLHREPQPQKLYTIGPMYRYGAPGRGRYREHWQLSVEALGTTIRRSTPRSSCSTTRYCAVSASRLPLELNSIGCRECRPAYLERLRAWLAEHDSELDADAARKAREPSPCPRHLAEAPQEELLDRRRRSATRSARPASRTSLRCAPTSTRTGVEYELVPTLVRGLDYYSRTTWEFVGPMDNENSTSPAAAATTTWSRRSAARRRRASASARGSNGC